MKYLRFGIIIAAAVGLFLLYSTLPLLSQNTAKFDTPDETINYFFANHVAKTGSIAYAEPLNAQFSNPIIFMRWMQSPGVGSDQLYPGTFVGFIILAGAVAKLGGSDAILFITPLLAVGSVLCMYSLTRNVFGHRAGMWAGFILATLPLFFYYASRTMFHTVPFLFFFLLGVAAYLHINRSRYPWIFVLLSSFGFGGALFVRFADIWWIAVVILALLIARPIGFWKSAAFIAMLVGGLMGNLAMYRAIYGSWFTFGYPIPGFSASSATTAPARMGRFFLPFGFYPRFIWGAFVQALWKPYSGFILLSILGFAVMGIRYWTHHRRAIIVAGVALVLVSSYMLALYGSWSFSDSPTPGLVTIGSSYTRYFLPMVIMLVPGAAYLVTKSIGFMRSKTMRVAATTFLVFIFTIQAWSVAWASDEGLAHVASQTRSYQLIATNLHERGATRDDIFLVRRGEDKILFPDFPRVINVDYLPEEMVRKNLENYPGTVWVSSDDHVFKKQNPYKK